ncbi:uncharacterized protein LOC131235372 [Magnolia sinica]|uniref:uncharacterized protein LOC131235372 n=1 Tax=Magnolia sinica TaxID=86752 RepID=UPI00265ADB7F|nr:uncharacterized protein LOC131235372 [Magnolia sinica]
MAIFSKSSNTWIFSIKALLLSTLVLSAALVLNLSVPMLREFFISVVPQIWRCILSWLTPPYLYFVINGIIISIAASSKFHHKSDDVAEPVGSKNPVEMRPDLVVPLQYETAVLKSPAAFRPDFDAPVHYEPMVLLTPAGIRPDFEVSEAAATDKETEGSALDSTEGGEDEDEFVLSKSEWTRKRRNATEYSLLKEKPLVSVRFAHKKNVKASPDGSRALGVAKPKRGETLESTWKTITDGRPMPLTRHLKKSDTWETHVRARTEDACSPAMKKSDTMREKRSSPSPSPGSGKLLRKESSLGQDDLNRRVEAFIKRFNEEMRLQRQESLKHYTEMINRGSH